jgi:hypothetical protein
MTAERNLVLVHTYGFQDVGDFQEIARIVQEIAPDIEVFIASNDIPSSTTRRRAGRRPTLVFSPGNLLEFRPMRGRIYAGSAIPKLEQLARFKAVGLPVPEFVEITPDFALPADVFGPLVVIKPGLSTASQGHHMTLMPRDAVRFQAREAYADDHPGRYGPMFAQRFIDTGPFINHHRVLTLFGTPLLRDQELTSFGCFRPLAFEFDSSVLHAFLRTMQNLRQPLLIGVEWRDFRLMW